MASARKHQCRSLSASPRSPGDSWRVAMKRAHPQPFRSDSPDLSSPQKWDVDKWRRYKRRRRDLSSESDSMDVDVSRSSHSSPIPDALPTPAFAATSAEFHIFPRTTSAVERKRRTPHHADPDLDADSDANARLARLRSEAFCQLQRTVEDNGDSFVKSMRVYETRRLRSSVHMKVKEAQRRGRRRSVAHTPHSDVRHDSGDSDDEVQIFAGENDFLGRGKQRAVSVGVVENKAHHSTQSDRCSSPGATCDSSPSVYLSDDDSFRFSAPNHQPSPSLSHTLSHSANSSLVSLALPPTFASNAIPPSSRSEKAIAALTLAMANGAGGLDDYEALRSLHTFSLDSCEIGEMWH